jgi:hypothetical protein
MMKYLYISALILSVAVAMPASAAPARDSITTEQVAAAMSGAGIAVSAQQVMLLADVVATTSAPVLKVESMQRWGDNRMRVRLDCANREECLPFFVTVNWSQKEAVEPTVADSDRPLPQPSAARPGPRSFVVRAGSPAVLLLEGDHIHIQLTVVCLENGASGQTIRVASKDHRQTYTAQVGDGSVLRAKL